MHDIQLVDLNFDDFKKEDPNLEVVNVSLDWLLDTFNKHFKQETSKFVDKMSSLEESIIKKQDRIKELENESFPSEEFHQLQEEQERDIKEHSEITKTIKSLCAYHQECFDHLTTIKKTVEEINSTYQIQKWDLTNNKEEVENLKELLRKKEAEQTRVVMLVEKKNRIISDLEQKLNQAKWS